MRYQHAIVTSDVPFQWEKRNFDPTALTFFDRSL